MCENETKKWRKDEIDFIFENFEDMSFEEMANKLGRSRNAVKLKCNRNGLKKRTHTYNKDYFKHIDTQEKAYWLGFIYADGYVHNNINTGTYEFGITLKKSDDEHLKKLNKCMCGNVEVSYRTRISNQNGKENTSSIIRFYSKEIVDDLICHGVFENKTNKMLIPSLDENLMSHFIRGYFDGNGCITLEKKTNLMKADITTNSKEFIESIRNVLYQNGITSYISTDCSNHRLHVRGLFNVYNFMEYIYADGNTFLSRKKKKYIRLLEDTNAIYRMKNCKNYHRS